MKPLKILVSAYACQPNEGSEPGVGWNLVKELANYHQVWVLTRTSNQSVIDAELQVRPLKNLQFIYCEPIVGTRWLPPARLLHYYFWQFGAYAAGKKLHRQISFDLVHHVTYVRYSTPSYLSLLPVPFVWGPVGGGETAPKSFWKDFSLRDKAYEIARNFTHRLGELDPATRLTARKSVVAWATTADTATRLERLGAAKVAVESALGLSKGEITQLTQPQTVASSSVVAPASIRFISIARLLHWKGIHLGLQAFAKAELPPEADYWILGDGPEKQRLQQLATDLGIAERVHFAGRLSRAETLATLENSHVLVHPSLHDSGGLVCLEAMAAGRPVLCLDLGGPAVQVSSDAGFKISAQGPELAVDGLATAMSRLAGDSELRRSMGQAGKQRISEHFSWENKAKHLAKLYLEMV